MPIYIIKGKSESGDKYKSKMYNKKPTKKDKKQYILQNTPEEINCGGPGDFGSFVYLEVEKI